MTTHKQLRILALTVALGAFTAVLGSQASASPTVLSNPPEKLAVVTKGHTALGAKRTASDALAEAQRKFASTGSTSYRYEFRQVCFCPPLTLRVVVEHNVVVSIQEIGGVPIDRSHRVTREQLEGIGVGPIPALFERMRNALRAHPVGFEVRYDNHTGVPTSVYIDPLANVADEEFGWTISGFRSA